MPADRSFQVLEGVAEPLEGAPRRIRREWSDGFKARLVAESLIPGTNVSAVARREGISPAQLFGWRRQALRNGTVTQSAGSDVPQMMEVEAIGAGVIEIAIGGVVIRAGLEIGEEHLRRVIRAVRAA